MKDREEYISILEQDNAELKKQLEENKNPLKGIFAQVNDDMLLRNCGAMHSEIDKYKNQQQEFIKYLEDEIKHLEHSRYVSFNEFGEHKLMFYKEILSKYKENIGDVEDE